jgi:hypothetical protein
MTRLSLALHRLVADMTTLSGNLLGPATLSEAEAESASRSSRVGDYGLTRSASPDAAQPPTKSAGLLVLNADDWGRDSNTTDRIFECFRSGTISSVSAMVFMEDSERAAAIAQERELDTGLHVNLTSPFFPPSNSKRLQEHQERISRYLLRHRFAQVVFHPGLSQSFKYVVNAQLDEYERLYGQKPQRLDGHHHMHLCANVLLGRLLPAGTLVRRSFSFYSEEKGRGNRLYRGLINGLLARRHHAADFFFSLPPLEPPERLRRIFSLAKTATVEVETHPVSPAEYRFLTGGGIDRFLENVDIARRFVPLKANVVSAADTSTFRHRLTCLLPYAFAFGATLYRSLVQSV